MSEISGIVLTLLIRKLGSYINSANIDNVVVWTSWLQRTIQTAQHIQGPQERWKTLNEIDAGDLDGLSYDQVKELYPEEYSCRHEDKFMYRLHLKVIKENPQPYFLQVPKWRKL